MTVRAPVGLALALAALLAARQAPGVAAETPPAEWVIERSDPELALPAGAPVTIENLHGDVRVRAGDELRLRLHAVAQRHASDPRRERIELLAEPGGGSVRVSFPESEGAVPAAWGRRRVDLAVEVPPGAALAVRTGSGLIEIRGHAGAVRAESVTGDVRLRVSGPVEARTEGGTIHAVLRAPQWSHPARFESRTGDIRVEFPARADAEVRLESQGPFTTDYSLRVERVSQLTRRGFARLGRGGPAVELKSHHGALRLVELLPESGGAEPGPD